MPHECKRLVTELVWMTVMVLWNRATILGTVPEYAFATPHQKVYFPCRNLNRTPKSFSPWPRRVAIRYNSFDWVP